MGPHRWFRLAYAAILLLLTACGSSEGAGRPVDVIAREYTFRGLPDTLEAGVTTFSIDNQGSEVHEIHVFKLTDGAGTVSDLLDKSLDEAQDKMTSVGTASAGPGEKESFEADLPPGRYAAVCLIPVGTLPGDGPSSQDMEDLVFDPNADTHMSRGMFAEFTAG